MITIPDAWQQLHWKQQVNLAQDILRDMGEDATPSQREMLAQGDKMPASAARAIIATEAKRQADEARKPTVTVAPIKEGERTLDVYLDYDVWVDADTRVRANPNKAQTLPFDLGKKMLDEGKARRADPLP
jgi:hypothetical protein